jgi:hypothetical protein
MDYKNYVEHLPLGINPTNEPTEFFYSEMPSLFSLVPTVMPSSQMPSSQMPSSLIVPSSQMMSSDFDSWKIAIIISIVGNVITTACLIVAGSFILRPFIKKQLARIMKSDESSSHSSDFGVSSAFDGDEDYLRGDDIV